MEAINGNEGEQVVDFTKVEEILANAPKALAYDYMPKAKTTDERNAEREAVIRVMQDHSREANTNITASLAVWIADICVGADKDLRAQRNDVDPLGDGTGGMMEFSFPSKKVTSTKNGVIESKEMSYYDQVFRVVKDQLSENWKEDSTIRALVSTSIRKAILLVRGYATIGVFPKKNKLTPADVGQALDEAGALFNETVHCKAIAVPLTSLATVLYDTQVKRGTKNGERERIESSAHANQSDGLGYLTTNIADALYHLHIEGGSESEMARDNNGWLIGLAPVKRETAGTQDQVKKVDPVTGKETVTAAAKPSASEYSEAWVMQRVEAVSYEAWAEYFKKLPSLADSGNKMITAFLDVMAERSVTAEGLQINPYAIGRFSEIAANSIMYMKEFYGKDKPPSFETLRRVADLGAQSGAAKWVGDSETAIDYMPDDAEKLKGIKKAIRVTQPADPVGEIEEPARIQA